MANKRMFSKIITNSARFLKMPTDSQTLYFHLCMNADDDGIVEAYSILKITGSNEDNLRVLSSKNFIRILNEDLVSHVLDWNIHNLIRADRKVDSLYKNLLLQIIPEVELIKPKLRSDTGKTTEKHWTDIGRTLDGIDKVRLGQVSIDKDSIDKEGLPPLPLKNNDEINNNNDMQTIKEEKEKTPTPHSAPPPSPADKRRGDLIAVFFQEYGEMYKDKLEFTGKELGAIKNLLKKNEKELKIKLEIFHKICEENDFWIFLPSAFLSGWNKWVRNKKIDKPSLYKKLNEEKY